MALQASKAIVPALVGAGVVSYIFWDLARNRKVFGGTVPRTLTKEWAKETERLMDEGWPVVAGKPMVMNPISRQNYRKASGD